MYGSKRYAYEAPVYRASSLLAALDNKHVILGIRVIQPGNQGYAFSIKLVGWLIV